MKDSLKLRVIVAGIFLLAYPGLGSVAAEKPSLRPGKVISSALYGHGANAEKNGREKNSRARSQDIWWNYAISSGDQLYSVVSRENPSNTGLIVNAPIKFYEAKNWMYIPRQKRKPIALKIQNKSKIKKK